MAGRRGAMVDPNGLATFLRAQRDNLKPADVGLPHGERRRVAGLRREEVAMLAGISTEYYQRLEQGRERQPSNQVLDALARALQLGDDATDYMRNLARRADAPRHRVAGELFDPGVQTLIDSWHLTPAYVQDRRMTVLAANALAQALLPYFAPQMNLLRALFLEPETQAMLRNWNAISATQVSWLRFMLAEDRSSDPELQSLIGELSIVSQRFRALWTSYDVKRGTSGPVFFEHPQVGPLDLRYRVLVLPETRHALVTYYAEPGSPSEERLQMLSSLAAPTRL
jgi:transcriptional regulator with XRE-family HTH domain